VSFIYLKNDLIENMRKEAENAKINQNGWGHIASWVIQNLLRIW